jgi:hypothetical protein
LLLQESKKRKNWNPADFVGLSKHAAALSDKSTPRAPSHGSRPNQAKREPPSQPLAKPAVKRQKLDNRVNDGDKGAEKRGGKSGSRGKKRKEGVKAKGEESGEKGKFKKAMAASEEVRNGVVEAYREMVRAREAKLGRGFKVPGATMESLEQLVNSRGLP